MTLKESTLYHLNACEKAKTKASWNYHYAIYNRQKLDRKFVDENSKKNLWKRLIRIYGNEKL